MADIYANDLELHRTKCSRNDMAEVNDQSKAICYVGPQNVGQRVYSLPLFYLRPQQRKMTHEKRLTRRTTDQLTGRLGETKKQIFCSLNKLNKSCCLCYTEIPEYTLTKNFNMCVTNAFPFDQFSNSHKLLFYPR